MHGTVLAYMLSNKLYKRRAKQMKAVTICCTVWRDKRGIAESVHSYLKELEPSVEVEYTYCVTANILSTQASPTAELTSTVNLQGM